jgi:hypothetical protein
MASDSDNLQAEARRSRIRGWFAIVFLVSFMTSIAFKAVVPRLLAGPGEFSYNPPWVHFTAMAIGLVAVCTVPMAWRWVYRRGR